MLEFQLLGVGQTEHKDCARGHSTPKNVERIGEAYCVVDKDTENGTDCAPDSDDTLHDRD